MAMGDITTVEGWDLIRNSVQQVMYRKNIFTLFKIKNVDPVSLELLDVEIKKGTGCCEKVPTEEEVIENWKAFRKLFEENGKPSVNPFYAVYDFGYYLESKNYRSMLVLFSYVPEKVKGLTKMVYSTNVQAIKEKMNIPYLIQTDNLDPIDYDLIKENISRIQITI